MSKNSYNHIIRAKVIQIFFEKF